MLSDLSILYFMYYVLLFQYTIGFLHLCTGKCSEVKPVLFWPLCLSLVCSVNLLLSPTDFLYEISVLCLLFMLSDAFIEWLWHEVLMHEGELCSVCPDEEFQHMGPYP